MRYGFSEWSRFTIKPTLKFQNMKERRSLTIYFAVIIMAAACAKSNPANNPAPPPPPPGGGGGGGGTGTLSVASINPTNPYPDDEFTIIGTGFNTDATKDTVEF